MNKKPLVIGLTGGMGSGKSTVAAFFEKKFGIPVYYADNRAKEIMHEPEISERIKQKFGAESFINGKLNRKLLAGRVFGNSKKLKELEDIIHPEVRKDFMQWVQRQSTPYVLLENAVLFKTGMDKMCDYVVGVTANLSTRMERIARRDGLSAVEIRKRLAHQPANEEFVKKSHFILKNDTSKTDLFEEVKKLHEKFVNLSKQSDFIS